MGPLSGVKIIEIKGIGPAPYAGMLLADMGAEVTVVERSSRPAGIALPTAKDPNSRGKRSIALNLKSPEGLKVLMALVENSDVLIEGFRPGVAERLGFGPEACMQRNQGLIYGRMTGWGQTGPLSQAAGHDINYIALTGSLAAIGTAEQSVLPLNLVGDYAGGSLFLVMGVLAALVERQSSGQGQVIDTAITDGSASLMSMFHGLTALGLHSLQRQDNMLDGAAHFYGVYTTRDNKQVSIGSIEPQFYSQLIQVLQLDPEQFKAQLDKRAWPALKAQIAEVIATKTRDEWTDLMEGTDICFAPVLDVREAPDHPHNQARETYIELDGLIQPAPAPRFSRTGCDIPQPPVREGADTDVVLNELGYSAEDIDHLRQQGVLT